MQLPQCVAGHLPPPCASVKEGLRGLDLQHVPRANNAVIDELSTKASTWAPTPDVVFERKLQ
jgi:hypothetical protein